MPASNLLLRANFRFVIKVSSAFWKYRTLANMVLEENIVSVLDPEPEQIGQFGPQS
jgi:hypothetical protein